MTGRNGCETMTHKQGNMQICADCQKCFCFFCLKSDFDVSQVSTWMCNVYSFYNLYNSHVSCNHGLAQVSVSDFRRLCCMVHDIIKAFHPRPPSRHQRLVKTVSAGQAECIPIVMLNLINFQIEPPPLPRRQHSQIEHLILCRECDCDCSKQQEQYNSTSSLFFSFCLQYDQVYSKTLNT